MEKHDDWFWPMVDNLRHGIENQGKFAEHHLGSALWLTTLLFFAFFQFFCYAWIVKKAGFSWAWSLLLLVPCINWIVVPWFAFAKWPALKSKRSVKSRS